MYICTSLCKQNRDWGRFDRNNWEASLSYNPSWVGRNFAGLPMTASLREAFARKLHSGAHRSVQPIFRGRVRPLYFYMDEPALTGCFSSWRMLPFYTRCSMQFLWEKGR